MDLSGLFIGFGAGVLGTTLATAALLRRRQRRVRAAERRAHAAERMAEIGSMTGGLAHEIKNPLSTIGLNAQLLIESIQDLPIAEDERSRLLTRMKALRREVERLRGILTDFLEFAGQIKLDKRRADLNVVVAELVDFYMPEAERHGVRLRADLAGGGPDGSGGTGGGGGVWAEVDVKLLKQALLNLMLNAVQAMSPAGAGVPAGAPDAANGRAAELILRTGSARDPDGRRMVQVHVIDTGPGIPPGTLERIFTPYFTTKSGGTGLGLPTARRLIEEHGGRIDVYSEVGRGTDFIVSVPMPSP